MIIQAFWLLFNVQTSQQCAATTTTSTPLTACQSCTMAATTVIMVSAGTKAFTSDTIDRTGTCATRTFVCDGNESDSGVIIAYNADENGTDQGTGSLTSVLTCDDNGQWEKDGVVITEIECEST